MLWAIIIAAVLVFMVGIVIETMTGKGSVARACIIAAADIAVCAVILLFV